MSARLARTADCRWAVTPAGPVRLGLPRGTTAGLLAGRTALNDAIGAAQATAASDAGPADSLDLLSPLAGPARVVAQAVNYRSHAVDSGFDPDTVPPAFFRKASHSLTGPAGDIIRPDGAGFLNYEIQLGLVIGADLPVGTPVNEDDLTRVNGEVRQDSTAADMIVRPARALTLLSRFQRMAPGDLLLTGTPGGTALKAPAKIAGKLATLLPVTRWKLFFHRQAANPRYLRDGDVITATITSPDGRLDLGTQRNTGVGNAS